MQPNEQSRRFARRGESSFAVPSMNSAQGQVRDKAFDN